MGSLLDEAPLMFNLHKITQHNYLVVQKLGVWLKPSCRIWYFHKCTIARKSFQHQNRLPIYIPASKRSSTTRCPPKLRIPSLHFRSLPAKGNRSSPSSIPCAPSKEEPKTPLLFHSTNPTPKPSKPQLQLQNKTKTALPYSTTEALNCFSKITKTTILLRSIRSSVETASSFLGQRQSTRRNTARTTKPRFIFRSEARRA